MGFVWLLLLTYLREKPKFMNWLKSNPSQPNASRAFWIETWQRLRALVDINDVEIGDFQHLQAKNVIYESFKESIKEHCTRNSAVL